MNKLLANALASSTQMNVTRKGFEILYTVVFINKPCFSFTISLSDKRHTHCGNNYSDVRGFPNATQSYPISIGQLPSHSLLFTVIERRRQEKVLCDFPVLCDVLHQ